MLQRTTRYVVANHAGPAAGAASIVWWVSVAYVATNMGSKYALNYVSIPTQARKGYSRVLRRYSRVLTGTQSVLTGLGQLVPDDCELHTWHATRTCCTTHGARCVSGGMRHVAHHRRRL